MMIVWLFGICMDILSLSSALRPSASHYFFEYFLSDDADDYVDSLPAAVASSN